MYRQDSSFTVPPPPKAKQLINRRKWSKRWWGRLIIVFLIIFFVLLIAMGFYVGKVAVLLRSGQITPQQLFGDNTSSNQVSDLSSLVTSDDPSFGPRDAKVVIVEFSDFQCPFCQQVQPVIKEILKNYSDQVLFIYRDFPLIVDHPQALLASMAAECAHEQGQFWEMHDKIFENPSKITETDLKTYAVQIGLNSIQFNDCLKSGKYLQEIENDLLDGYNAGVQATPTFFINGVKVAGAIPLNIFEQIIISELSR